MKRIAMVLCCALAISFLFGSCGKKEEKKGAKVIGVTLLTRGHMFYRDLEDGLKQEAAKHNYDLIITSADFDLGKQTAQIEDFVARKVDAILVCPVDSKGVGTGIRKANKAGIPVFTADIAAEEGDVVCHIASDNVAGGRLAGEYLAKLLGGKGKIGIINQPAITSVLDRVQGFREAIAKYPGIEVAADVNGQGVRDKSLEVAADALQAHPDLNGIFGINDDSALGALDAVQQFKRSKVVIVGYDATPPAADAIMRGTPLKADVVQYPKKIGSATIDEIRACFAGEKVPRAVPVDVGIVDREALSKQAAR
ncbi:MAG: sugar ABC transporter substrate-binding protein [Ignavibacteriales bacterium CG07_land_8_20_14_0_80_59_12]|nr:MAG: sugar ABC transporter substrate-binding protein [Ignavibacteriales bacterium CG07_land_8_20_14_0_80_59_12]